MRRKLTALVAVAVMTAMMLASAGMASAAPGKNGKGAENANPRASFGISTAIASSGGGGGCNIC